VKRAQGGFTLVEVVLAMVLVGSILLLTYSGLSFALRSWDAGDANGRRIAERQLAENFLRRELSEMFPMRFKDAMQVKMAFEGSASHLRFVSARPPGIQMGGLSLVGIEMQDDREKRTRDLVMLRAMPDDEAVDFGPLDKAERHLLLAGVDRVDFGYFGSENDFKEAQWHDSWTFAGRVPELIRMRVRTADGAMLPDLTVRIALREEAGCLENSFQRLCRPRRPNP
jgi:prepilin-type N-terminal cleavage/methylation domain-containing protein